MVYASAGIEYYLFYIQIRWWWREVKMPSFRKSFAHAKFADQRHGCLESMRDRLRYFGVEI